MPRVSKSARNEAIASLRKSVRKGDTLYVILRHRSASGMSRVIQIIKFGGRGSRPLYLGYLAAEALGWRYDRKYEGVVVTGVGMDTGFHLIYSLARVLFKDGYALKHEWL